MLILLFQLLVWAGQRLQQRQQLAQPLDSGDVRVTEEDVEEDPLCHLEARSKNHKCERLYFICLNKERKLDSSSIVATPPPADESPPPGI